MHKTFTKKASIADDETFSDKKQRIYNFLRSCPVGVLSSVTPNHDPHGAVIYFTVNKTFDVSFLTKTGTHKYDNLKHNDHAMLTVFDALTQTTVQISGIAKEVTARYEINGIAQTNLAASMKTSYDGTPPILKLDAGNYTAFKIEPKQVRMAVYARPDGGDYSELFETLESFELEND